MGYDIPQEHNFTVCEKGCKRNKNIVFWTQYLVAFHCCFCCHSAWYHISKGVCLNGFLHFPLPEVSAVLFYSYEWLWQKRLWHVLKISKILWFDLTTPPTVQQNMAVGHTTHFSGRETGSSNFTNLQIRILNWVLTCGIWALKNKLRGKSECSGFSVLRDQIKYG